jgi:hypothetical protein
MAGQACSDSIGPFPVLTLGQNRKRSSSAAIERRRTVQKLTAVNPWAIHSNEMTAAPLGSGSSFLRTCPGGGYSKIFSFRGDVVGKVNEPGAVAEPFSSRPRRSKTLPCWPPARAPNQIRGVLATWQTFTWLPCPTQTGGARAPRSLVCDSCGHRIGKRLQLDVRVGSRQGQNSFVGQCGHQALGVEHGFVLEHEIDGAGQVDSFAPAHSA